MKLSNNFQREIKSRDSWSEEEPLFLSYHSPISMNSPKNNYILKKEEVAHLLVEPYKTLILNGIEWDLPKKVKDNDYLFQSNAKNYKRSWDYEILDKLI